MAQLTLSALAVALTMPQCVLCIAKVNTQSLGIRIQFVEFVEEVNLFGLHAGVALPPVVELANQRIDLLGALAELLRVRVVHLVLVFLNGLVLGVKFGDFVLEGANIALGAAEGVHLVG